MDILLQGLRPFFLADKFNYSINYYGPQGPILYYITQFVRAHGAQFLMQRIFYHRACGPKDYYITLLMGLISYWAQWPFLEGPGAQFYCCGKFYQEHRALLFNCGKI